MNIFPNKGREKPMKKSKPFYVFKFYWKASDTLEGNLQYRLFTFDPREYYGEDLKDMIDDVLGGNYHELVHSTHAEYVPHPPKKILLELLENEKENIKYIQNSMKKKKELVAALTERLNKE